MFFSRKKSVDEAALIDALSRNNKNTQIAENQLFEAYKYLIKEGIRKYSLSEEDAFDAYSDTLLNLIYQIKSGRFEGRSSLKTYIYQIFSNKCVDVTRKNTTKKAATYAKVVDIELFTHFFVEESNNMLQKLVEEYDFQRLASKLNEIGEKCKAILQLWSEGFQDKFIAEEFAYNSAAVVKTTRMRCLEKLRELYNA